MRTGSDERPVALRAAFWCLIAVAAVAITDAINTIAIYHRAAIASDAAYADTWDGFENPNSFRDLMKVHIGFGVLMAAIAVVVALVVRRGSPGGRLTAFVFTGFGLLCFGVGSWVNAGHFGFGGVPGDEVTVAAQRSAAAVPGWSETITMGGAIFAFLLLAAVIVLLTRQPRPVHQD